MNKKPTEPNPRAARRRKKSATKRLERPPCLTLGLQTQKLSWIEALAWGCTRDIEFSRKFAGRQHPSSTSRDGALVSLTDALLTWSNASGRELAMPLEEAENELSGSLVLGIIQAEGLRPGLKHPDPIPATDWLSAERRGAVTHDALFDFDQNAYLYMHVAISERQLMALWEERKEDRLLRIGGEQWDLAETVYWVSNKSHTGFVEDDSFSEASCYLFDLETLETIQRALCAGSVLCSASMKNEPKQQKIPEQRDPHFWMGTSISDTTVALFQSEEIQTRWPLVCPDAWLVGLGTRTVISERLTAIGMTRAAADRCAERAMPQPAKRGPKPK